MQRIGFVLAIGAAAFMLGCNDAGRAPVFTDAEVQRIVRSDTFAVATDSVEADTFAMPAEHLPAAVDELFDDFIFAFDQNSALQRQRVAFPLPVDGDDGTDTIVRPADWHHQHVFMHQDFCTVLWSSPREMLLADDISVDSAAVEQIYLHSRHATSMQFARDSADGHWRLLGQRRLAFADMPLAHFLDFYARFATDSAYQRAHVSSQLRFVSTDEDGEEEPVVGFIDVDQWFEFAPELPRDVLTNIRYGQDYNHLRRIIMQMRGISNGLEIQLSFVRDGDAWRLVGYEN